MVWFGLEQDQPRRKSTFDHFQKAVQRVFLINPPVVDFRSHEQETPSA